MHLVLSHSNSLDLNKAILRKTSNLNARTSGENLTLLLEELLVDLVDDTEVVHVLDEDGGLDNIRSLQARGLNDSLDVLEGLASLSGDALGHGTGGRVDGDLTRGNDDVTEINTLDVVLYMGLWLILLLVEQD